MKSKPPQGPGQASREPVQGSRARQRKPGKPQDNATEEKEPGESSATPSQTRSRIAQQLQHRNLARPDARTCRRHPPPTIRVQKRRCSQLRAGSVRVQRNRKDGGGETRTSSSNAHETRLSASTPATKRGSNSCRRSGGFAAAKVQLEHERRQQSGGEWPRCNTGRARNGEHAGPAALDCTD